MQHRVSKTFIASSTFIQIHWCLPNSQNFRDQFNHRKLQEKLKQKVAHPEFSHLFFIDYSMSQILSIISKPLHATCILGHEEPLKYTLNARQSYKPQVPSSESRWCLFFLFFNGSCSKLSSTRTFLFASNLQNVIFPVTFSA